MTIHKYILDERGKPVVEPDLLKWARWMEAKDKSQRVVAQQRVNDARVSTVFLGLDYNFSEHGAPVLWETMVFGGALDQAQERCSGSREQAEAMHARMVQRVRAKRSNKTKRKK